MLPHLGGELRINPRGISKGALSVPDSGDYLLQLPGQTVHFRAGLMAEVSAGRSHLQQ